MKFKYVIIFLAFVILVSITYAGYRDHLPFISSKEKKENGVYTKSIRDKHFTIIEIDNSNLIRNAYPNIENLSMTERTSIQKEYDKYKCFLLEISIDDYDAEIVDYNNNSSIDPLTYYLFDMQNDIKLIQNEKVTPCSVYFYERSNQIKRKNVFLIGFNMEIDTRKKYTISYENRILDLGKLNFEINSN